MATLREYFEKDQGAALGLSKQLTLSNAAGEPLLEITARLNLSFEANALYISYYIPETDKVACPSRVVLNSVEDVLNMRSDVYMEGGMRSEDVSRSDEAIFTGRIYIYTGSEVTPEDKSYINERAKELGHSVKIRDKSYAEERASWEKPLAFISYDLRDREAIAKPLALALQKIGCPVWYDEFSLKVGDSLRASIEKGIKECRKCVFIITPNFLANGGWAKREYESIFTRELVEKQNVILPICQGVTFQEIYAYSPVLADRVAVQWKDNADEIARRLAAAIRD
jgi:hypothetical protein